MDRKIIAEVIFAFLGVWMIALPSFFLKFLAKGAQFNYENLKSNLDRIKREGPANLNEKLATKFGPNIFQKISMNKDVYKPPTETQKWLMRSLGILFVCISLGVLFNLIGVR